MNHVAATTAASASTDDDDNYNDIKSSPPSTPIAGVQSWDASSEEDAFTLLVHQRHSLDNSNNINGTPDTTTSATAYSAEEKKSGSPASSLVASVTNNGTPDTTTSATAEEKKSGSPASSLVKKKPGRVSHRTVSWGIPDDATPLPSYGPAAGSSEVTLAHVLATSPEMEAETYILQAIEKCKNHRPADNTPEMSALCHTIAAEEIQKREDDDDEDDESEEESDDDEFILPSQIETSDSPSKQFSMGSSSRRFSTESSSRQFCLGPSSRQPSQGRFRTMVTNKSMRSSTVEGRLFGLTTALTELDHEYVAPKINNNDSGGSDTDSDELRIDTKTNFTAADKLVETTQKLRNKNKDATDLARGDHDIEVGPTTGPASSNDNDNDKCFEKNNRKERKSTVRKNAKKVVKGASNGVREEWELLSTYFASRKDKAKAFLRKVIVAVLVPSLAMAFFLFYVVENPELCLDDIVHINNITVTSTAPSYIPSLAPTQLSDAWGISGFTIDESGNLTWSNASNISNLIVETLRPTTPQPSTMPSSAPSEIILEEENLSCEGLGASVSWWFLFLGVRQVITLMLALLTQSLIVDYLALSSRILLQGVGPIITLFLVQAKGWPFILTFWALYSLVLNSGDTVYAHHWGWWQDFLGIFNEYNPSGTFDY
jgi:hypothetical protein